MNKQLHIQPAATIADFDFVYELEADKSIQHLYLPNFTGEALPEPPTSTEQFQRYQNQQSKIIYIVYDNDQPIGNFAVVADFPHLVKTEPKTAWISLGFISSVHGTPVIKESYQLFEDELVRLGYRRIELGVFEFNIRAQKFYEKIGFQKFIELPEFTFYDDKWWKDYRYEKLIGNQDYVTYIRSMVGHEKIIMNFAGAIIYNEKNEILLQQRSDSGLWGVPGGALELDEPVINAAIREVFEETQINMAEADLAYLGVYSSWGNEYKNGDKIHSIMHTFMYEYQGEIFAIDHESLDLKFFGVNNLPEIFCEQNEQMIKDYFNDPKQIYIR